jgi:hypothetical protein
MKLEALQPRAEISGEQAAERARDRILARADLPAGIFARAISGGIMLTGKGLIRRIITDPKLRNFTHE